MNIVDIFKHHLPALVTYGVIALAVYLGHAMIHQSPKDLFTLQSLAIQLQPGEDITIGRKELLQRPAAGAAEQNHVQIKRDAQGHWWAANVAVQKRVDVRTDTERSRFLKRWTLKAGDAIEMAGQIILVREANASAVKLVLENEATGQQLTWHKGDLALKGISHDALAECGRSHGAWWWRQLGRREELRLFSLGGLKDCVDRWSVPGAQLLSAWVNWRHGEFTLGPGGSLTEVYFARQSTQTRAWRTFTQIRFPLISPEYGKVNRFIIGRTHFQVTLAKDRLILTPTSGQDYFYTDTLLKHHCEPVQIGGAIHCKSADQTIQQRLQPVRWLGEGLLPKAWIEKHRIFFSICAGLAIVLFTVMVYFSRRLGEPIQKTAYEISVIVPALCMGLLTLGLHLLPGKADLSVLLSVLALGWFWTTLVMHWGGRLKATSGILWCSAAMLGVIGTLTLTQLGVGALNSRWMGFAYKHIFIVSVFAWFVLLLTILPAPLWRQAVQGLAGGRNRVWVVLRFAIPLSLIAVLILQALVGSESGLFGVQPIETVKFVVILMAAIVGSRLIEIRRIGAETYRYNPLYFLAATTATALMFIVFTIAIMLAVRDFSPFLIVFTFMSALVWRLAAHPEKGNTLITWALRGLVLVPLILIIGLGFYIYQYQPEDVDWIPQYDRLRVWANPPAYPHTGSQLLGAIKYVHLGQWTGGTDSWFGENGDVVKVPAIHNDFVGAFLLHKFGGYAGLALLFTQLTLLFLLWRLSDHAHAYSLGRDYRDREFWQIISIVVFGAAWMFSVHWFISWGNILGLLPVMGQPMTWISAANSHLLLFALPAFYTTLIISWIAGEELPAFRQQRTTE